LIAGTFSDPFPAFVLPLPFSDAVFGFAFSLLLSDAEAFALCASYRHAANENVLQTRIKTGEN